VAVFVGKGLEVSARHWRRRICVRVVVAVVYARLIDERGAAATQAPAHTTFSQPRRTSSSAVSEAVERTSDDDRIAA
jgi:hypothetical protein